MTRDEAIHELEEDQALYLHKEWNECVDRDTPDGRLITALDMAINAIENIDHLTDRPCDVCEYHGEHGCSKWTCVFTDKLFGDMR